MSVFYAIILFIIDDMGQAKANINFWFNLIRGGIGEVLENYGLFEIGSVGYVTATDELRT